ncbi:MAG: ATP-binding cassette domain-containing protein [Myxococcota bacterium]
MTTPPALVLRVHNVRLRLGVHQVLDGIDFDIVNRLRPGIETGQVVGLLGPSGVGKTQLLRILAGLRAPDEGTVLGPDGHPFRAGSVGVVFQNYPLLAHHTVKGNLLVAAAAVGMTSAKALERVNQLLTHFRLEERADFYPAQLSGGQRQRVAIAQQLVNPTTLLLMDEPFSGLDPAATELVQRLVTDVANIDDLNTVVLVTHDIRAAMAVSDTLVLIGRDRDPAGKIVSGAKVKDTYDLVAAGLMWQENIGALPEFAAMEREIRGRFAAL